MQSSGATVNQFRDIKMLNSQQGAGGLLPAQAQVQNTEDSTSRYYIM